MERLNSAGDLAIPGEPCGIFYDAANEIERLRLAIRRLAEQDATLSVCDGNVTVTLDATLTDEEREAIREACDEGRWYPKDYHHIYVLRTLLERR
jgi:hypothetical protein